MSKKVSGREHSGGAEPDGKGEGRTTALSRMRMRGGDEAEAPARCCCSCATAMAIIAVRWYGRACSGGLSLAASSTQLLSVPWPLLPSPGGRSSSPGGSARQRQEEEAAPASRPLVGGRSEVDLERRFGEIWRRRSEERRNIFRRESGDG